MLPLYNRSPSVYPNCLRRDILAKSTIISFHVMLWGAVMDMFLFGQILTQIASLSTLCCEQNRTISGHTDILAWRVTSSGRECRTEGRSLRRTHQFEDGKHPFCVSCLCGACVLMRLCQWQMNVTAAENQRSLIRSATIQV